MISIPLIRRELTSDLLGRHIYLFGAGSSTTDILRRLAEAGAQEGTVVISATEGTRLSAAALFRPHLAIGAVPLFSTIATLALADALADDELCVTPVWPDQVSVEGEPIGRIVVETAPAADHTIDVVLGADIDVCALEARRRGPLDWNGLVAAFLNALDKWATAYATRGPAAVSGAMRFLPRGPVPVHPLSA
jgi:biotin-(acetyl-CoA carboxylase) ligase